MKPAMSVPLPTVVIGAGGHGKVILEALLEAGIEVIAVVDSDAERHGTTLLDVPVVGGDQELQRWRPQDILLANGIGSTGQRHRRHLFERMKAAQYRFATIIHPSAVIGREAMIAEGGQVMAGAVLQPGVLLGRNAIVNTGARIDHDCVIGDHCHVAPGAVLCGGVRVDLDAHVGAGAVVIQNMVIGEGALVAAGAVVVRPVSAGGRVGGVPAKEMGS